MKYSFLSSPILLDKFIYHIHNCHWIFIYPWNQFISSIINFLKALREPYTCYLQGGLNFAASRAGVLLAIQKAYFKD